MSYGNELAQIDFSSMIGGPLDAVIRAQAQAAMTTVDFIKQVGLNKDGVANEVAFRYRRPGQSGDQDVEHSLVVPLLTIVPVPFIRVDETVIDFKAKIVGVNETDTTGANRTEITGVNRLTIIGNDALKLIRGDESEKTDGKMMTRALLLSDEAEADNKPEVEALRRAVTQQFDQYVKLNKKIPPEILTSIAGIDDPGRLADTIAAHLPLKLENKQAILDLQAVSQRLEKLLELLEHPDENLRWWCVQLLCEDRNPPAVALQRFAVMAREDKSSFVRLALASALQRLPNDARWPIAQGLVAHAEDAGGGAEGCGGGGEGGEDRHAGVRAGIGPGKTGVMLMGCGGGGWGIAKIRESICEGCEFAGLAGDRAAGISRRELARWRA